MVNRIILIILLLSVLHSAAMVISPRDTLKVALIGGAFVTLQKPSGAKASESAMIRVSVHHIFSDNLYAKCSIKGSRSLYTTFIEQGYVSWYKKRFTATGGMLTNRYGSCSLYKPEWINNPLFEKWILWDVYGFGVSLGKEINRSLINGAITLNSRESGAIHFLYDLKLEHFRSVILGGFKSYSIENQDNCITVGGDVFLSWEVFKIHTVIKYDHYTGFGSELNSTMKPGNLIAGFTELKVNPLPFLEVSMLAYIKNLKKRITHTSCFWGGILEYMPVKWLGIGGGAEFLIDDSVLTAAPEVFFTLRPVKEYASINISFKTHKTNNSSRTCIWSGNVWLNF